MGVIRTQRVNLGGWAGEAKWERECAAAPAEACLGQASAMPPVWSSGQPPALQPQPQFSALPFLREVSSLRRARPANPRARKPPFMGGVACVRAVATVSCTTALPCVAKPPERSVRNAAFAVCAKPPEPCMQDAACAARDACENTELWFLLACAKGQVEQLQTVHHVADSLKSIKVRPPPPNTRTPTS